MMTGVALLSGMRLPCTEISEDEASIASEEEQVPIKEEKAMVAKKRRPTKGVIEETQESIMVESDKEEDDEEDDGENAENEYEPASYIGGSLLIHQSAGMWSKRSSTISLMKM